MSDTKSNIRPSALRLRNNEVFLLAALAVFVVRLFYVQIIQHGYYVDQAKASQMTKLTIVPERGAIYARDGAGDITPLVLNRTVYAVIADPHEIKDAAKVRSTLQDIAGGELRQEGLDQLTDKQLRYVVLARQVSYTQAQLIKDKNLPGVGLQKGSKRTYPEGNLASQVLGYVNSDGEGQYGIEEALQGQLAGSPGLLQSVTDVRRIPLTIGDSDVREPAKNGDTLVLSIDRNIQLKAEEELAAAMSQVRATKGSVLVMNPKNGQVLAMANLPSYDPEKFNEVSDYSVFQNRITALPYEAGSVTKTLTVGAGLDSGAVTVNSSFNDTSGCTRVEDASICNVEEDPRQANANMLTTLRYSLNTGVVHVLRQMGGGTINRQARDTFYQYFHDKFRFGQLTGVEQAGEAAGVVIAPSEQEGNNVRYANMAFGQGMDVTMIQTAAAFSASINGGTYYQPTLIYGTRTADGSIAERPPKVVTNGVLSTEHSNQLRELVWQGRKQGFFGSNDPAGYIVGGKTGTSQVIDPRTGRYSDDNSIGSYLGFGGGSTPEYVIMVRVDDSKAAGHAGTTAAGPVFNRLSNWLLQYLNIQPVR